MIFGKDEGTLLNELKKLDSITDAETVKSSTQKVHIVAEKSVDNTLKNWSITEVISVHKSKTIKKGKNLSPLMNALNNMDKTFPYNEEINILCYCHTNEVVKNGKRITRWFNISPCIPYEMKNGEAKFNYINIELTEDEYAVMMESRLALYNEFTEDVYPIRKIAFPSIGKLMDAFASFKNLSEIPLGPALLLADKLAETKSLQFIYRNKTKRVKPLIGIAGSKYVKTSQHKFLSECLSYMATKGIYTLDTWSITDQLTSAKVSLTTLRPEYKTYLLIETSDIPGTPMSVSSYVQFGKASVLLKRNTIKHEINFEEVTSVDELFSGIYESFDIFANEFSQLCHKKIKYSKKMTNGVAKIIGKKNMQKTEPIPIGMYNAANLYSLILNHSFFQMKGKQANELTIYYKKLFDYMIMESEVYDGIRMEEH